MTEVTERTRRVVEWVANGVWEYYTVAGNRFARCVHCGCSGHGEHETGCVVVAARNEVASWVVAEEAEADIHEAALQEEIAEAAVYLLSNLDGVIRSENELHDLLEEVNEKGSE